MPDTSTPPIAVIGASAAGTFAAVLLARRGYQVRIYERTPELSPEPRTLIVTSRVHDYVGSLIDTSILNEIHSFELIAGGRSARIPLLVPDLIIERSELIRRLVKEAIDLGVEIHFDHHLEDMLVAGDALQLSFRSSARTKRTTQTALTVIGADGAQSTVARCAGLPTHETAPLVQAIVRMPSNLLPHESRVWFTPQITPYFFWLIPESPEIAALGVIGNSRGKVRAALDAFLDEQQLQAVEYQAAKVPIYTRWLPGEKTLGSSRVFLVGDAAGHVKVSTVGGVVTGFRGALSVVEKITTRGPGHGASSLRRELGTHALIRRVLNRFDDRAYEELLSLTTRSLTSSLSHYSRDEALRVLWAAAKDDPRLAMLPFRIAARNSVARRRNHVT